MKAITNAKIVLKDRIIENGTVYFNERITAIEEKIDQVQADEVIDAQGKFLIPGLIDIHMHGSGGADVMDATDEALMQISDILVGKGVTRYLATTLTMDLPSIEKSLICIRRNLGKGKAVILGAHLEGPFLSEEFKGMHPSNYLLTPDVDFVEHYRDVIRIVTVAPELDKGKTFISRLNELGIIASIGHTAALYDEVMESITAGAKSFTHLFNAMSRLDVKNQGASWAALVADQAYVELIADLKHVLPNNYPIILKSKPLDKILLVTDSLSIAGLPPGKYFKAGQTFVTDGLIGRLDNGVVAGSVIGLIDGVRNFYQYTDISLHQVVRMASLNQAELLGLEKEIGSIEVGKLADLVLVNEALNVEKTFVSGKLQYKA